MLNKKGEINMEMMIESKLAELELSKGSPIEIHEKIKEELLFLLHIALMMMANLLLVI